MKKLILILATISLFSCKKKEEVKPQITTSTQKQSTPSTPTVSNCNKDSSWTRSHPKTTSLYYFKENCTHITITYAVTKKVVTIARPTEGPQQYITNYPNYSDFRNSTDPNKFYYEIRTHFTTKQIIYFIEEANYVGVGGSGMKMP